MKTNFKTNLLMVSITTLSFLVISNALAAPGNSNALNDRGNAAVKKGEIKIDMAEKVCDKLGDLKSKITQRLSNFENSVQERWRNREENWKTKTGEVDKRLANFRTKQDENLKAHIAKLTEKATTDEQKAAVAKFQSTMEVAISVRRTAVDSAIDTFRNSVNKLVNDRQSSLVLAASAFKSSVAAAFNSAESDCSSGKDAKTIRQNLHASLKAAREKFVSDRQNVAKISDQVQALNQTKKQAIEKAIADFKAAMQNAVAELKKSFPTE
jgi:hypothetical protein